MPAAPVRPEGTGVLLKSVVQGEMFFLIYPNERANGPRANRTMDKIPINGLKLSGPLVLIRFDPLDGQPDVVARICRVLNDLRVNIAFMTSVDAQGRQPGMYCIASGDHPAVAAAFNQDAALADAVRFGPEVGLLSFFPHRSRLNALGRAVHALNAAAIAIHGLASSISTMTFVIDYDLMDKGAAALTACMDLPPNPASFRAEFSVRQEKR